MTAEKKHYFDHQQQAIKAIGLPAIDEASLQQSWALNQLMKETLDGTHAVSFSLPDFMSLALYESSYGYYMAGRSPIGHDGDFVTAPEISSILARALASYIAPQLIEVKGHLLEFGAGRGALAVDLWRTVPEIEHYWIVEPSPILREQQRLSLRSAGIDLERCHWIQSPEQCPEQAILIGNEVLDALPFFQVKKRDGEWLENRVISSGQGWESVWCSVTSEPLIRWIQQHEGKLPDVEEFVIEAAPQRGQWLLSWLERLTKGGCIFLDYGHEAREFFSSIRRSGSLQCYFRHHRHGEFTLIPGAQDITSHVNFSELCGMVESAGCTLSGFCNQRDFILQSGCVESLPDVGDLTQRIIQSQQLQQLMMPGEMGDLVKAIAFTKQFRENAAPMIPCNLVARL